MNALFSSQVHHITGEQEIRNLAPWLPEIQLVCAWQVGLPLRSCHWSRFRLWEGRQAVASVLPRPEANPAHSGGDARPPAKPRMVELS